MVLLYTKIAFSIVVSSFYCKKTNKGFDTSTVDNYGGKFRGHEYYNKQ